MKKTFYFIIVFFLFSNATCQNETMNAKIDKSVVAQIDLQKYLGTWYEIARYDHKFEKGLVGVTANYSLRSDGLIKVLNSGYKNSLDGNYSEAIGKAKIPNLTENSKLKVSFFWIFYADYFVMELEPNYQWAVIGSSSDNYLWILSRAPHLNKPTLDVILEKIKAHGYNIDKLYFVPQK